MEDLVDFLQNLRSVWGSDVCPSSEAIREMSEMYPMLRDIEKKYKNPEKLYACAISEFFAEDCKLDVMKMESMFKEMIHPHHVLTEKFIEVYSKMRNVVDCECEVKKPALSWRVCRILEDFYYYNNTEFDADDHKFLYQNKEDIPDSIYHLAVVNFCKVAVGVPSFMSIKNKYKVYAVFALTALMDACDDLSELHSHVDLVETYIS